MPKDSRFSRLPGRIVVPNRPAPRRLTVHELLASFAIAAVLVALATLAGDLLKGR